MEELLAYIAQAQRKAALQPVNYKFLRVVTCVPQNVVLSLKSYFYLLNLSCYWHSYLPDNLLCPEA